jgi:cytidine deaminase
MDLALARLVLKWAMTKAMTSAAANGTAPVSKWNITAVAANQMGMFNMGTYVDRC